METLVFASRVSGLGDARYFAGMGVRWLGIVAVPNQPGYMAPERFREIAGWVAGVEFILETDGASLPVDFTGLSQSYGPAKFLVHPDQCEAAEFSGIKYGIRFDAGADVIPFSASPEFILIRSVSTAHLDRYNCPILLSSEQPRELLEDWLGQDDTSSESNRLARGLWVMGSAEEKPGIKEYPAAELLEWLGD